MTHRPLLIAVLALGFAAVPTLATASTPTPDPVVAADWQMNDAPGSTVMVDSSGLGHDGSIPVQTDPLNPEVSTGNTDLPLTDVFYTWSTHCPACAPADPTRVISVPDTNAADGTTDELDIPDPNIPYTLTFRFRTTHKYGNYMQKGQSASKGGQIKVQAPKGNVQCLFKGADGTRVGTGYGTTKPPLSDGQWHTVSCIHTATQVKEIVDGGKPIIKNGSTGPINNTIAMTIGGKLNCDQVKVTCDYYSGDMDFVTVSHG